MRQIAHGRRGPPAADLPYFILQNISRGLLDSGGEPDRLSDGAGDQGGSLVVDEQCAEWVGRSGLALLPRRFPDHWSVESMMVRRLTRRLRTIKEAAPAAVLCPESLSACSSSLCTARYGFMSGINSLYQVPSVRSEVTFEC